MSTLPLFGSIISAACDRQGVSHAELARRLGVAKPRVPVLLRGKNMTEQLFRRCAAALHLDLEVRLVKRHKRAAEVA